MARPIVLSNGELHVGLNGYGTVHDFYYPYVGFENHSAGGNLRHRIGVWVDGSISWIDNPNNNQNDWVFTFRYPHSALVGHIIAKNEKQGILLEFDDFVDSDVNVFFRNVHVVNLHNRSRDVRLFMHQAFAIGDSRSNTDTAQYIPDSNAILHYRGRRAFVVSGEYKGKPFDQYTVGLFGIEGREGTYRDADDGSLGMNNVEHGRVDSTIRFKMDIGANSSERVHYWIAAGTTTREALNIHNTIQEDSALTNLQKTADWWDKWLAPTYSVIDKIPTDYRESFLQSIMVIKSQIDIRGAVIASTDTSMLNYSRDAYAYCWPRDGAFAVWPLIRMGYKEEAYRFFQFGKHGMHPDGYMMHKYRADGALGSSWHSYVHEDGLVAPPIQEDETALPVFMFNQYYQLHPDPSLLKEFYHSMIIPMANFMTEYVDEITGLPKPSYDLWEQTFLTSTYTTAVTYAALIAASDLATAAKDQDNAVKWRLAANDIQTAAHKHLYHDDRKVFYRGLTVRDGQIIKDGIVDCSSVFGAYIFGLFDAKSPQMKASVETVEELFGINKGAIGLPRYENDEYRRVSPGITGNLWFITSFWLAQYYIDSGKTDKALTILNWAKSHALSTGVMGEQFDPVTNQIISPAPLTWTHAEYVATLLDLIAK
ncbi:MAG: glycoside hydrolase family 15 protein [Candidatus Saccharibacteria bacterium]